MAYQYNFDTNDDLVLVADPSIPHITLYPPMMLIPRSLVKPHMWIVKSDTSDVPKLFRQETTRDPLPTLPALPATLAPPATFKHD